MTWSFPRLRSEQASVKPGVIPEITSSRRDLLLEYGARVSANTDGRDKVPRAKLTKQNPAKAKEINDELQKMDLSTASKDLPDKCQSIDQRLEELAKAKEKTS
nr:hypothetical protein [Pseudomonas chlororaphis]